MSKIRVGKKTLLINLLFLLSFVLLPLAPIASASPRSAEQVNVELVVDIQSDVELLDVRRTGRTIIVHSDFREPVNLQFGGATGDFAGVHEGKLGFHLDRNTQEAWIIYKFDRYESGEYEGWLRYQLEGYGKWDGESMPIGIIAASGDFAIYEMRYSSVSKGKSKSATIVEFEEVWSGILTFDITITPV